MKKYIKVMNVEDYIKEYEYDCFEVGVQYVYIGVYDNGEDSEETSIMGYVYEDGKCEIVGCRQDCICEFSEMMQMIRNELIMIESVHN